MKKGITIIFIGLLSIPVLAKAEPIEVGKGTLKLGGIFQTTLSYTEATSIHTSFGMKRARFLLSGSIIPDKVKYFVQTEVVGAPSLLDTKLQFFYLPKTEIAVGRFLPNFTYYMPMSTAKLDLVNYPLITTQYAVWRQVGIQTTTTLDRFDLNVGVFNGYPANNMNDTNNAKDLFGRVTAKPIDGLQVFGYAWMGNAFATRTGILAQNRVGGGASFEKKLSQESKVLTLRGEYLKASNENAADSMGYYAQAGLKVTPKIEILSRYDGYDPNVDAKDDGLTWITGGLNYYLDGTNVMFYLNYIKKINEVPSGSSDPKDDEVVLQAQVAF
ncbi:MAG: hypothetical protein HY746_06815 [Elusimicrobia bacterium]|nr:hypothetical protein [Elusimicrobiota bacterium]